MLTPLKLKYLHGVRRLAGALVPNSNARSAREQSAGKPAHSKESSTLRPFVLVLMFAAALAGSIVLQIARFAAARTIFVVRVTLRAVFCFHLARVATAATLFVLGVLRALRFHRAGAVVATTALHCATSFGLTLLVALGGGLRYGYSECNQQ